MIEDPTVLVLGAGMSKPYGFPTAEELNGQLTTLPAQPGATTNLFSEALHIQDEYKTIELLKKFTQAFMHSGPLSIDRFLEQNSETYGRIGKAAIAYRIKIAEQVSRLYTVEAEENSYKTILSALLGNAADPESFKRNCLSIITFNYDRSLEIFLLRALKEHYSLSDHDAEQLFESIPLVHVHGSLGKASLSTNPEIAYGGEPSPRHLADGLKNLRVVAEADFEDPHLPRARDILESARLVCFLGFGYDVNNLRLLGLAAPEGQEPHIFEPWESRAYENQFVSGTLYKMAPPDYQAAMVNLGLQKQFPMPNYKSMTCNTFLTNSGVLATFCQWDQYNWIRPAGEM